MHKRIRTTCRVTIQWIINDTDFVFQHQAIHVRLTSLARSLGPTCRTFRSRDTVRPRPRRMPKRPRSGEGSPLRMCHVSTHSSAHTHAPRHTAVFLFKRHALSCVPGRGLLLFPLPLETSESTGSDINVVRYWCAAYRNQLDLGRNHVRDSLATRLADRGRTGRDDVSSCTSS